MKTITSAPTSGPDRQAALEQYRQRVGSYDLELVAFEPIRRLAIAALDLRAGQTVFDIGCGTGLSLQALHERVGPQGRVVGVEQCPEMMARARRRVQELQLGRVDLIEAPAEEAMLPGPGDAALFHFTHDVLRRAEALDHVLQRLRPGARLAASGLQWASPWALPVNLFVWGAALRSVSSLQGLERPWSLLAERVGSLAVRDLMFGAVFLARGTAR